MDWYFPSKHLASGHPHKVFFHTDAENSVANLKLSLLELFGTIAAKNKFETRENIFGLNKI